MTKDEALTMCLEYIETDKHERKYVRHAIKAALEQPEQEPTQWRDMVVVSLVREGINKHKARELADHFAEQPEPVAKLFGTLPVYDTAAQRPWQGLTPEDLAQIDTDEFWQVGNHMAIAMAVEDKLKEKNSG